MRLGFDDHLKENIILSFSVVLCEHSFVSIVLNGGMHGFFKGKRGIRQEDPISPLLFVIVMEYLTRLLRKIGKLRGFKFHSRWKIIGLNHLVFAHDLMLFCYGDKKSVELMMRGLKTFDKCSGLKSNPDKSAMYFGNVLVDIQT